MKNKRKILWVRNIQSRPPTERELHAHFCLIYDSVYAEKKAAHNTISNQHTKTSSPYSLRLSHTKEEN